MTFDPTFPAYPILSLLVFLLVLIPLPWHLQAWNAGTCLYMIWTAIGCLNYFINSIIWHSNAIDWAPVWCDISTRLTVGLSVAIPAASLCINRRLYKIASVQTVSITYADKRRAVLVDLAIGLGIPFVQMGLQMIVEGHRYDIWEDIGCLPKTFNTPPAYPLTILWPLVIGLVSATYCIMTLRAFMIRRIQFQQLLARNASLTANRYFRLMALATIELLFNTPLSAYGVYLSITSSPIQPWKGLADAHFDWYTIDTFPAILWRWNTTIVVTLEITRWSIVFCGFVFFAFFGFAEEARRQYCQAFWEVAKIFGYLPSISTRSSPKPQMKMNTNPSFVLPIHAPHVKLAPPAAPSKLKRLSSTSTTTSRDEHSSYTPDTPSMPVFKIQADRHSLRSLDVPSSPSSSIYPTSTERDLHRTKSGYFLAV